MAVSTMEFLQTMYPQIPAMGRWVLGLRSTRAGVWRYAWVHTLETIARRGFRGRKTNDVFLAPAIQESKDALALARSRRARVKLTTVPGAASAVLALPALWVELTVASAGEADLPPDRVAALGLLSAVPLPPSVVVSHASGCDVYWLLRQPWELTTADDRATATEVLSRLRSAVVTAAADRGWQLDPEVDLAQHLRLPGTLDHQFGAGRQRRPPVLVTVDRFPLPGEDRRYHPEDFAQLPAPPTAPLRLPRRAITARTRVAAPPANFEAIFEGCGWLRQGYERRAVLPAKVWHAVLGVVGRSAVPEADGRALAHWNSQGHPGTTRALTDDALDQALGAPHPTCATIAQHLDGAACVHCPHRGKIASPLDLGRTVDEGDGAERPGSHPSSSPETSSVDPVVTCLAGAEVRMYDADGVLLRAWRPVEPAAGEAAASDGGGVENPSTVPRATAVADLVLGLEALLADLGGSASARQILDRLAATASSGRYRRLRSGLVALDPRWRGDRPPGAQPLGMILRRYAGRSVRGVVVERLGKSYQGTVWQARRDKASGKDSGTSDIRRPW